MSTNILYQIDPMALSDIDAVCVLEADAKMSTFGPGFFSKKVVEEGAIMLVARNLAAATEIAGFFSGWVTVDELEVDCLVVSPANHRQGIGRSLMKYAIQTSVTLGAISAVLEVRESNHSARSLYESLGFTAEGLRRNYYRDPTEDALIMRSILVDELD